MGQFYPDYRKVELAVSTILNNFAVTEPPVDPVRIAREMGVRVVFVGFDANASGISGFYDCEENTIFVNKDEFPLRQTFTVAHELGHKVLHEDWAKSSDYRVLLRDTSSQYSDYREKEANAFAAGLLMPRFLVDRYWGHLSVEQMSRLFAVSVPVVKNRLSFLYGV
jgi:Zn-dependent peptidase ImmA (M78 family)